MSKEKSNNMRQILDGPGGKWIDISSGEITIGKAGSGADFEVDGINDSSQIALAINEADISNRSICFLGGIYNITSSILLPSDSSIEFKQTELHNNVVNAPVILGQSISNVRLTGNLKVDGLKAKGEGTTSENLIQFGLSDNIVLDGIFEVYDGGQGRGVRIAQCTDVAVRNIFGSRNTDTVYIFDSSRCSIDGVHSEGSYSDGLNIRSSEAITATNISVYNSERNGILVNGSNGCYVQGVLRNNGLDTAAGNYHGLGVNAVAGVQSHHNIFIVTAFDDQDVASQYNGVRLTNGTHDNKIIVNGFGNTNLLVDDSGTNNIII